MQIRFLAVMRRWVRVWGTARARRTLVTTVVTALVMLTATVSGAQYISPGLAETTNTIPSEELFDNHINNAKWNVGSVRLSPWIGLRDASLVSTQNETGGTEDDFTLTVGAGLRAYLPTGKFMWSAHALPEYVWWEDDDNKRGLNGRYGLGLFGYFNRLRLEVSQRRDERQGFFSPEIQELTTERIDASRVSVEVDVARNIEVFGVAELRSYESQEDESPIFPLLDRDEDVFTLGVRYRSPRGWTAGLGFEDRSTDFGANARNLSNSGTSELVELGWNGAQLSLRLAVAFRDLEADDGSAFGVFDTTTGSFEALWTASSRGDLLAYSRRYQTYSIDPRNAFSIAERQGARFNYGYDKFNVGFLAEIGEDEFRSLNAAVERIDDVIAFGADVRFSLGDLLGLSLSVLYSDYDSNLPGFDRDVTNFGFAIQLGSLVDKLKLGLAGGDW